MSSNAGDAKDKLSRIVELRKIEEENNQRLYEFFCDRVKGLDKKSDDYKKEFKRYHLAFIYLNEGRLFRLCGKYQIFEDDKISGGNGKNLDTSKKMPPAYRIQKVNLPADIYKECCNSDMKSDYISEIYMNKSIVDVLVKCIDEYDPNFNGGNMLFIKYFNSKLQQKLRSEYQDIINEKLVMQPWVIDDRNGYVEDQYTALKPNRIGLKRLSTVVRYLYRMKSEIEEYRRNNPGCSDTDIRNAFKQKSLGYSEEQRSVLLDIILNGINPRHVSMDGNPENVDAIQSKILKNEGRLDEGLETYLDDDKMSGRDTIQFGSLEIQEDMIRALGSLIDDFLEEACSYEESFVLENYCEYTPDKNTVNIGEFTVNYGQFFNIVYGKEKIKSPEYISEQLRSKTHKEWDSDGVIRLYHRTLQKMNYYFSEASRQ